MIKSELIKKITEKTLIDEAYIKPILDTAFELMLESLAEGEEVVIHKFGSFKTIELKPKIVYDFHSKKTYKPSKPIRKIKYTAPKHLKNKL